MTERARAGRSRRPQKTAKRKTAKKTATNRTRKSDVRTASVKKASAKTGSKAVAKWELRLYVAGQTPRSVAAIANLRRICAEHLDGRYWIEIVDLVKKPQLARDDQIVAIPTLIRRLPPPIRKIIGDLSRTNEVLVGLQLGAKS